MIILAQYIENKQFESVDYLENLYNQSPRENCKKRREPSNQYLKSVLGCINLIVYSVAVNYGVVGRVGSPVRKKRLGKKSKGFQLFLSKKLEIDHDSCRELREHIRCGENIWTELSKSYAVKYLMQYYGSDIRASKGTVVEIFQFLEDCGLFKMRSVSVQENTGKLKNNRIATTLQNIDLAGLMALAAQIEDRIGFNELPSHRCFLIKKLWDCLFLYDFKIRINSPVWNRAYDKAKSVLNLEDKERRETEDFAVSIGMNTDDFLDCLPY